MGRKGADDKGTTASSDLSRLIADVLQSTQSGDSGFTGREFAQAIGKSDSHANRVLRNLFRDGVIKAGSPRMEQTISGFMKPTPTYVLAEKN